MNYLHALILGLIQGLTEFFPVSSSAHLKFAKIVLGLETAEGQVLFDLSCHAGTLAALAIFFRKEIADLFGQGRKRLFLFLAALLPLVPFYFLLKPLRKAASAPELLGVFLIATAAILWAGQKWRLAKQGSSYRDAACIGIAQGFALIPGISRSASTIATARWLGWTASEAVRFSFLLSIPTVLGGMSLEALKISAEGTSAAWPLCLIGFAASFAAGSLIVRKAISFLEKGNLKPCALYCLFAGILFTLYLI